MKSRSVVAVLVACACVLSVASTAAAETVVVKSGVNPTTVSFQGGSPISAFSISRNPSWVSESNYSAGTRWVSYFSYGGADGTQGSYTYTSAIAVPADAVNISPITIRRSSDDCSTVFVADTKASGDCDGSFGNVTTSAAVAPAAGTNTPLRFEVVNAPAPGANPTGLIFNATVSFDRNAAPVCSNDSISTSSNTAKAFTLACTDANSDPLTYSIVSGPANGTLSGTGASRTYTPTAGYSGPDSFTYKANDGTADSNVATVSITVIDTLPPDTTITSGPTGIFQGTTTNDSTPTFSFTSTETGSTFECKVDTGAYAPCSSPFTTASLPDGTHTFAVRAKDAAGNIDPTPATKTFTVAPRCTILGLSLTPLGIPIKICLFEVRTAAVGAHAGPRLASYTLSLSRSGKTYATVTAKHGKRTLVRRRRALTAGTYTVRTTAKTTAGRRLATRTTIHVSRTLAKRLRGNPRG